MTERLTKRVGDGVRYDNGQYIVTCYPKNNNLTPVDKLAAKLCDLEDKIENGVMIEPPVMVGQTVWVIVGRMLPHIAECEVIAVCHHIVSLDNKRKVFTFSVVARDSRTPDTFFYSDIGRRVFFAKEHAEKVLAERKHK